jgi:hypothetical protein
MKNYLLALFDFRKLIKPQNFPYVNIVLFLAFAATGYIEYFYRQAPPERSLYLGLGFTMILGLYLFMLKLRKS